MQEAERITAHPEQEKHNRVLRSVTRIYEDEGFDMEEALTNSFNIVCYYAMSLGLAEDKMAEALRDGIAGYKANYLHTN
jgi:hypothetical protein